MTPDYFNAHLRRALKVVQAGSTELAPSVLEVPMEYYRGRNHWDKERSGIWEQAPLPLLFSSEIASANDFAVKEVLGKSILIVRGDDGTVRAFENYCRHRGGRPASGCGNRRRFVCPYHAWSYDSRGRLAAVPGSEGFTGLEQESRGLVALPCEERHGLVWIKLLPGAALDVAEYLGDELERELALWSYADARVAKEAMIEVDSSWKLVVENFAETYHFATVHGKSIPGQMLVSNVVTHDAIGEHHRICFAAKSISALAEVPECDWNWRDHLVVVYWLFPSLVVVNVQDAIQVNLVLPLDARRTSVRFIGLDAGSAATDDPEALAQQQYIHDSAAQAVVDEDGPIMNGFGGMVAATSQPSLLIGRNEIGVQHAVRTIARRIGFSL